ncbi:MAG: hypothetical protein LBP92_02070 [Deltaproteobacteria bacterium]|jgi:hypothetical protein|nr:hypothetical protein [Deltaproteobacteria bacterium]
MKKFVGLAFLFILFSFFNETFLYAGFCDRVNCQYLADSSIANDAKSWFWNRYDQGSARIEDVQEMGDGFKVMMKVLYTYNGGRHGWVELDIRGNSVYCFRYHDYPNECRTHPK